MREITERKNAKESIRKSENVIGQSTWPHEFMLKRKDGTFITAEIVTHLIKIQHKTVVLGTARDVGPRKKNETDLKSARDRLIQSEKMAAIGSFSAGIALEVKNPLGVILSGAELLEVKLPRYDEEVTSTLDKIREASLMADFVLQALLQFAWPRVKAQASASSYRNLSSKATAAGCLSTASWSRERASGSSCRWGSSSWHRKIRARKSWLKR